MGEYYLSQVNLTKIPEITEFAAKYGLVSGRKEVDEDEWDSEINPNWWYKKDPTNPDRISMEIFTWDEQFQIQFRNYENQDGFENEPQKELLKGLVQLLECQKVISGDEIPIEEFYK